MPRRMSLEFMMPSEKATWGQKRGSEKMNPFR
jgi:hypothetical protein